MDLALLRFLQRLLDVFLRRRMSLAIGWPGRHNGALPTWRPLPARPTASPSSATAPALSSSVVWVIARARLARTIAAPPPPASPVRSLRPRIATGSAAPAARLPIGVIGAACVAGPAGPRRGPCCLGTAPTLVAQLVAVGARTRPTIAHAATLADVATARQGGVRVLFEAGVGRPQPTNRG